MDALAVILDLEFFPVAVDHLTAANVCLVNDQLRELRIRAEGLLRLRPEKVPHLLPDQLPLAAVAPAQADDAHSQQDKQRQQAPADIAGLPPHDAARNKAQHQHDGAHRPQPVPPGQPPQQLPVRQGLLIAAGARSGAFFQRLAAHRTNMFFHHLIPSCSSSFRPSPRRGRNPPGQNRRRTPARPADRPGRPRGGCSCR